MLELRRLTLGTRLFGILLCVFLFTVGILLFYYSEMQSLRQVATEQTGEIVIAGIREKVQVGTHSMAIALSEVVADVESYTEQELILQEAVKNLRFEEDESGYYFIYRGTTAVTIPPNPDLDGQDLRKVSDENGVYFVRELAEAAQSGGGFVNYVFAKPGAGLQPKVSYAQMIPGTDYWIGTGAYTDNVERRQAAVATLIREQTQRSMLKAGTVVLGFFGLVLVPLVSCLIRSILQPIRELRAVSKRIATGDLLVKVAVYGQDEIANLLATMLSMQAQLARVVTKLQRVGDAVSAGSVQTASMAEQLSQGATQQTFSTQALAASMAAMDLNIQQNAQNAQETVKIAHQAAADAQRGSVAVQHTVAAMRTIAEKITIIKEIASNTKLLALNAAIEVVRESGQRQGFAVVAAEVQNLAELSQTAAREISEVSQHSVQVAEEAGRVLKSLVPDIQRTAELINEVSAASAEQRGSSQQVSDALSQLDKIVQQNASQAEEMASMAEQLAAQTHQLRDTLGFFKVYETSQRWENPLAVEPGQL